MPPHGGGAWLVLGGGGGGRGGVPGRGGGVGPVCGRVGGPEVHRGESPAAPPGPFEWDGGFYRKPGLAGLGASQQPPFLDQAILHGGRLAETVGLLGRHLLDDDRGLGLVEVDGLPVKPAYPGRFGVPPRLVELPFLILPGFQLPAAFGPVAGGRAAVGPREVGPAARQRRVQEIPPPQSVIALFHLFGLVGGQREQPLPVFLRGRDVRIDRADRFRPFEEQVVASDQVGEDAGGAGVPLDFRFYSPILIFDDY